MARFQTGTLGRSVKRFGRFPRFGGNKFKRVAHSWKFVDLEESAIDTSGATANDVIIIDDTDWTGDTAGGTASGGVKNVVLDLDIAIVWLPDQEVSPTTFNSARVLVGIWCLDADDTGGLVTGHFAAKRPIWWRTYCDQFGEATADGTSGRRWCVQWRARARQRWMDFDEELRLKVQLDQSLQTVTEDMRLNVFGRVSWETP